MVLHLILLIWGYMTLLFIGSIIKRDMSIVDIGWGMGFVGCAWYALSSVTEYNARMLLVTLLITLWGVRLSTYLLLRNYGKPEDKRYTALRASWGAHAVLISYFKVFMLQGVLMLIIATPAIITAYAPAQPIAWYSLCGIVLWIVGFLFQAIGDAQLHHFLHTQNRTARILTTGLWRYTRHPNYFGELAMWWGIFILVVPVSWGWLAVISPLTISFLLLYVSGIPMLEKPFEHDPEFQAYKMRTSALVPWPSDKNMKDN